MKRWTTDILLIIFCFAAAHGAAQEAFSGRLTYQISYLEVPNEYEGSELFLPAQCVVLTDGSNWKMTQMGGENHRFDWLYRAATDSLYAAFDLGVERLIMPWSSGMAMVDVPYRNTGEQVRIADATATRYEGTTDANQSVELVLLDGFLHVKGLFGDRFNRLPAVFYLQQMGVLVRYELIKIKQEFLDETYFAVPAHYRAVAKDEYNRWLR